MKVEQKLQIDVIKGNRMHYRKYGDLTLITDGYIGVYLKNNELKIDLSKMQEITNGFDTLSPSEMQKKYQDAKETNHAISLSYGFAILVKSESSFCYLQEKLIKMFPGKTGVKILNETSPVLIMKYGIPYGIILPVKIREDIRNDK